MARTRTVAHRLALADLVLQFLQWPMVVQPGLRRNFLLFSITIAIRVTKTRQPTALRALVMLRVGNGKTVFPFVSAGIAQPPLRAPTRARQVTVILEYFLR